MSESMDRSRQATSGWRRVSFAAFSALFAFILARFALRNRPALPEKARRPVINSRESIDRPGDARRDATTDDDALDRHIRLRIPVTMASAPSDFTAQVLARIAAAPAPRLLLTSAPVRARRRSRLRSFRIFMMFLTLALVLMLVTGVALTMVSPSLAVAILDAVISGALAALAAGRALGRLLGDAAATPWMIPAALGGLLGFLLLSWSQLARQFGRDPQEA
jgi:hypothetical protein